MSARKFHRDGSAPALNQLFVFGSNLSGIHGAGAARAAYDSYGAEWGVAEGLMGNSYAIPTVRARIAGPLSLPEINEAVSRFIDFAKAAPSVEFLVTRIGCGLAGHRDQDIAPMFSGAPINCSLPDTWAQYIKGESL